MRPLSEAKVTIIGLGFLMEYIFPCFRRAKGARTAQEINAVTADAGDLEGKRARLGIPVLLGDNARALRELEPDCIFFAPPPCMMCAFFSSISCSLLFSSNWRTPFQGPLTFRPILGGFFPRFYHKCSYYQLQSLLFYVSIRPVL